MERILKKDVKKTDPLIPGMKNGVQLVLNIFVAILVFSVAQFFFDRQLSNDNAISAALCTTIIFLSGIYAGRFMSLIWVNKGKKVLNRAIIILPLIIFLFGFFTLAFAVAVLRDQKAQMLFLGAPLLFIATSATGMLIKMVRAKVKLELQTAHISAAHSQTELHLLQEQLSPHFLFNTLNNLYGISLSQHEKIPALLLKLSELLRYSVYDAKEPYVLLKDEVAYLNNYIEFEKIRIGEKLNLTVEIEEVASNKVRIAPMLLIVFLENAFKHSKNTIESKIHIYIGLKVWGNSILFSVKNSYNSSARRAESFQGSSGLGLVNVRKRLELLYPNGYDLKIEDENDFYTVMLRVNEK
jgi:sensor histidine kinase YesM